VSGLSAAIDSERHGRKNLGRIRPLTLLIIAAVILVVTTGLALSFLLAR